MKKTIFLLASLLLLSSGEMMAQWSVGIRTGFDYNQPVVNTQYAYTRSYTGGAGALLSVPVQYDFLDWVGLVLEPGMQFRTSAYKQSSLYNENQYDIYAEMPLMVNFSFGGKKVRGFLHLGGYLGYWAAGWRNQYSDLNNDGYVLSAREFTAQNRRLDAGIVGGIGLKWLCDHKVSMSFEYRYYYDCLSSEREHKVGNYDRFDNLHSLTLGVHFNFPHPEKGGDE